MVQAHAKCQDNPAGPSSSIRPQNEKGKASSSSIETRSRVWSGLSTACSWHFVKLVLGFLC
ncbi:hypothetical protein BY996DRAFT_6490747 [Phakopsora pachyrhizi]|nr:hypothetical protein BY996DRAFT_6490747 [Phakopsora pachyrhizi]